MKDSKERAIFKQKLDPQITIRGVTENDVVLPIKVNDDGVLVSTLSVESVELKTEGITGKSPNNANLFDLKTELLALKSTDGIKKITDTVNVAGPLTDTELRASAVPVSPDNTTALIDGIAGDSGNTATLHDVKGSIDSLDIDIDTQDIVDGIAGAAPDTLTIHGLHDDLADSTDITDPIVDGIAGAEGTTATLYDVKSSIDSLVVDVDSQDIVDGIAGAAGSTATLHDVVTALDGGLSPTGAGTTDVATSGTAVPIGTGACKSVMLQAQYDNTDNIMVGTSGAQPFILAPGDFMSIPCTNLDQIYIDAVVDTEGVAYFALGG